MAVPRRFLVPRPFKDVMRQFGALPDDVAGSLLMALDSISAESPSRAGFVEAVKPFADHLDPAIFVDALVTLEASRETISVARVAKDVATSDELGIPEADRAGFSERLERALVSPGLMALGRAYDVLVEHDRVMTGARILTDLRPIFGDDVREQPVGAVIVHNLKLDTLLDGENSAFYVALDVNDLENLKTTIDRALDKSQTLLAWMQKSSLPHVNPGVE